MKRSVTLPDLNKGQPKPSYGYIRERVIRLTPNGYQCKLFCNGTRCKYCNGTFWSSEQQAITGLYSTWITDDLLAMARPTTSAVENCSIVKQFVKAGITSIVNLQHIGEHASCGPPLHPCGFSYNPEEFMRHEIFYYNFGWPDFGVSSLPNMLDMVKVLNFSLNQGKTAVHCHAGLGRTGVLICCYLIWDQDISPGDAIEFFRKQRPNSIQSKDQIELIYHFAEFLKPLKAIHRPDLDLTAYLNQQQLILHGVEARILRHIPKIAYVVCERLLELAGIHPDGTLPKKLELLAFGDEIFYEQIVARNRQTNGYGTLDRIQKLSDQLGLPALPIRRSSSAGRESIGRSSSTAMPPVASSTSVTTAPPSTTQAVRERWLADAVWRSVVKSCLMRYTPTKMDDAVESLNASVRHSMEGWNRLAGETDPLILATLLGDWFRRLRVSPVTASVLLPQSGGLLESEDRMNASQKWTILYLSNVFSQLCEEDSVAKKDSATLLCDWLTWTREDASEHYFQSCLDTVAPVRPDLP
uniref:Uncharacterized protein n=1 Tax=Plectus sambesii TaxID=2011161 RepID=A0A914UI04_9BILA